MLSFAISPCPKKVLVSVTNYKEKSEQKYWILTQQVHLNLLIKGTGEPIKLASVTSVVPKRTEEPEEPNIFHFEDDTFVETVSAYSLTE